MNLIIGKSDSLEKYLQDNTYNIEKYNKTEKSGVFYNGQDFILVSKDNPDRLRGLRLSSVTILDPISVETYAVTILPALFK